MPGIVGVAAAVARPPWTGEGAVAAAECVKEGEEAAFVLLPWPLLLLLSLPVGRRWRCPELLLLPPEFRLPLPRIAAVAAVAVAPP